MIHNFKINNSNIRYSDIGSGKAVVLLHGYLESLEKFESFATKLSDNYRVITVDLPGHGLSDVTAEPQSIEGMAKAVNEVIKHCGLTKVSLFGHSMGGYVTLAFAELYGETLSSLGLINSHPFADAAPTIENRNREIALVREGKKDLIINTNIPKGFSTKNLSAMADKVSHIQNIALKTKAEGIIAALESMKARKQRTDVLKTASLPVLFVYGKQDNYIPASVSEKIEFSDNSTVVCFENSGHQSFIEEETALLKCMLNFLKFRTLNS